MGVSSRTRLLWMTVSLCLYSFRLQFTGGSFYTIYYNKVLGGNAGPLAPTCAVCRRTQNHICPSSCGVVAHGTIVIQVFHTINSVDFQQKQTASDMRATTTTTTTRLLVLLLGAVLGAALLGSASADAPAPTRRLVAPRRLAGNAPSDLFNALLKDVAPALEKEIGHMKFKNYDHGGVKLTNLRTFDFDCSDGCLSGKISNDLKSVSLSVHKFSLRIHSRYKAKKGWITLQGE